MELFSKGNAVKLLSHHNMFLLADEDQKTIRQSRKRYSRLAIWTVETVVGNPKLIRLRSYHGTYLTASSKPFLLGTTGEKVTQTQSSNNPMDCQTHWEPVGHGVSVKLKSWCGKWMRANGGTPPWRKSVTHDEPPTSKTKNWLLWYVITVDGFDLENMSDGYKSSLSSPVSPHLPGLGFRSTPGSPVSGTPKKSLGRFASSGLLTMSPKWSPKSNMSNFKQKEKMCSFNEKDTVSAVEFFRKAKAVRMRSSHNKYLTADEDEQTVNQCKNGSTENAQWTVEPVGHSYHFIRLKSCYGKYLTASNDRFLLGATGKKVMQLKPSRLDSTVEWEPVKEGSKILLKTINGNYLRANDGPPPRRKAVTHDNLHSSTLDSISWDVDVVEILINPQLMEEKEFTPSPRKSLNPPPHRKPSNFRLSDSHSMTGSSLSYMSNSESEDSPSKADEQIIDYHNNPPSKAEMKPSKKKQLNSLHSKTLSSLLSISDSDFVDSPSKLDGQTIDHHINPPPFNAAMKSTISSKKTLHLSPHRKLLNSPHSKTTSFLSDISDSNFDQFPSTPNEPITSYHINQPFKTEMKSTPSSKKMMHMSPHRKPSSSPRSKTPSFRFDKSESDSDESSKKKMHPPPHWKPSNSPHSKTPSSLSDISDSNFDQFPSTPNEPIISYHINQPFKTEMKSTSSSKKMMHMSPHRTPSSSPHSKTPSFRFDKLESDSDESSEKKMHPPPHWKPSNSPHSKTPSSLSDISDSNFDEPSSSSDEIGYHINHPFKPEIKSTSLSKKHLSPHRKSSNSPHLKTPSYCFDKSDSDSDESPSKADDRTIDHHISPPFKTAVKSTSSSKKKLHPPPHRKLSNSPHLNNSSSLSDMPDSECNESPSKLGMGTLDSHIDRPFKVEMNSTSLKKTMYRKLSNSPHSKTPSSLSDKSDSEADESPSKLDVQTVNRHKKPSLVRTPCSISDKCDTNPVNSPLKSDGRTIYYSITDERHMEDKSTAGYFFTFRGNSVTELTQTLREETGLEDVVVCTRNPLSGKLSPLCLQLPPNNGILHIVLLSSSGSL